MEKVDKQQENRVHVRAELYQAGKKNMGGAAYNVVSLDYDNNKEGLKLKQID